MNNAMLRRTRILHAATSLAADIAIITATTGIAAGGFYLLQAITGVPLA